MKNSLKRWLFSSLIAFVVVACNKHITENYPTESNCDKYAGKYLMYDPDNDTSYEMIIDCKPYTGDINTNSLDSIFYYNFAYRFQFGHLVDSEGKLDGTIINPLVDSYGYKWNFANFYTPDYINRINVLVGDSIYLYFQIDNTAYWQQEGVPYQSITSVHKGVKIH